MFLESRFKKVSAKTQLEFVRTLLLDYAYQKDYSKFKETLGKAIKIIDKDNGNSHAILASIYEEFWKRLRSLAWILFIHLKSLGDTFLLFILKRLEIEKQTMTN